MLNLIALLLLQGFEERDPLQPYEEHSASGAWTLEVRPSSPRGTGPMRVSLRRGEEVSFAGELPWTFERAGVSDAGTFVGYANDEKLRIGLFDARGTLLRLHEFEHTSFPMHELPQPMAAERVLVHSSADMAWIRVYDVDAEGTTWYSFRLSGGEALAAVRFQSPLAITEDQGLYEREAVVLGDTGLTLLHWWFADYDADDLAWSQDGAVFALHDLAGKVVWHLPLLDDYTARTSEEDDDRLEGEVGRSGVIASVGPGARFALRHVQAAERVEYEVERAASGEGWSVREVARAPWSEATPASLPEPEELALSGRRDARLGAATAAAPHAIHGVLTLGFTAAGELELLRREAEGAPSYARLSTTGELLYERGLGEFLPAPDAWPRFHELDGERWLLQFAGNETTPWLVLDARAGTTQASPLPDAGFGSHVAATADGGYLALLSRIVRSLAFTELALVHADGTLAWSHAVTGIGPDETEFDRAVYFGSGLARTGEVTFTLLGSRELVVFDLTKAVHKRFELEPLLGQRPGYMDGLLSDGQGGVLFKAGDEFHHVDAFGTRIETLRPQRLDGSRPNGMDGRLCVAPDGRLWTSDGERVYRLGAHGLADLELGPPVLEDALASASVAKFDALGRVLLQDHASGAVHVFDAQGQRLALCRLAPKERPRGYFGEPFRGNPDGTISVWAEGGFVTFDADGKRTEAPLERPQGRAAREEEAEELARPDGTWLEAVVARAALPDGRKLVLERAPGAQKSAWLHFYSATGEPAHTLEVPLAGHCSQLSVGSSWVVIGGNEPGWTLVRLADERCFRFTPDLAEKSYWILGQTSDGKRLLLVDARRLELVSFELP